MLLNPRKKIRGNHIHELVLIIYLLNLGVLLVQWISFNNLLHPNELTLTNDGFQNPIIYSGPNFNLWRVSFHYFFNYFSLELTFIIFFVNMQPVSVEASKFWDTSLMVSRFVGRYLFYIFLWLYSTTYVYFLFRSY